MMLPRRVTAHLARLDFVLIVSILFVLAFGLMAIASIGLSHDPPAWGTFWKQFIVAIVGLGIMMFGSMADYRALRSTSRVLYLASVVALIAVFFFGETLRGTRGWFVIGGLSVQPVEFVKWFLLIVLAKYFATWARNIDRLKQVVLSGVSVAVLVLLIFLQPDLGSAFLLFGVWFGMLIIAGMRWKHIALMTLLIVVAAVGGWFFALQDYQHERIRVFLDPARDPLGRGYNITQARIAVGAGQFFGSGLGFGSQSQLKFLPEAETDFIFAVIAEELGFIGVTVFFAAWAVLLWRLIRATRTVQDDFALFFVYGAVLLIFLEFAVTVGMNIGFLPVTGLTLPFASVGGSSLIVHFFILATVQSIIVRRRIS